MEASKHEDISQIKENIPLEILRRKLEVSEFDIAPRLDDAFLSRFIRVRKNNVDEALKSVQKYYHLVQKNLDLIENIQPSEFESGLSTGAVRWLRMRSTGRRIAVFSTCNWDTKRVQTKDLQLTGLYQLEYISMETTTLDCGVVIVCDISGITLSHTRQFTYKEAKRCINFLQDVFPVKICEIHIVNLHPIACLIVRLSASFLKPKLRKRLFVHSNVEGFHKYIDPEILPLTLGGNLDDALAYDLRLNEHILRENVKYEEFWNPKRTPSYKLPPYSE